MGRGAGKIELDQMPTRPAKLLFGYEKDGKPGPEPAGLKLSSEMLYDSDSAILILNRLQAKLAANGLAYRDKEDIYGFSQAGYGRWSMFPNQGKEINFEIILSGELTAMTYQESKLDDFDFKWPTKAGALYGQIQQVFEDLGFSVQEINYDGGDRMADDDALIYAVKTRSFAKNELGQAKTLQKLANQVTQAISGESPELEDRIMEAYEVLRAAPKNDLLAALPLPLLKKLQQQWAPTEEMRDYDFWRKLIAAKSE